MSADTYVIIGVIAAAAGGIITMLRSEIRRVEGTLSAKFGVVDAKFETVHKDILHLRELLDERVPPRTATR